MVSSLVGWAQLEPYGGPGGGAMPRLLPGGGGGDDDEPAVVVDAVSMVSLSFHLPLHRFVGAACQRLCAQPAGEPILASLSADLAAATFEQIVAGLPTAAATALEDYSYAAAAAADDDDDPEVTLLLPDSTVEGIDPMHRWPNDVWNGLGDWRSDEYAGQAVTAAEHPQFAAALAAGVYGRTAAEEAWAAQAYGSKFLVRSSGAEALLLPPLRLAAAVAAVDSGLWVRNGGCIQEQALNYSSISPPLCRHFADLDRLAVQLGAAAAARARARIPLRRLWLSPPAFPRGGVPRRRRPRRRARRRRRIGRRVA